MSDANKSLVLRWFDEVWNKGDATAIDRLLAPDAVIHGAGAEDLIGPTGFKTFHRAYRNSFPDVRVVVDDIVAERDTVAFRWTATATHRGDDLGFAATHRPVVFGGMGFIRAERGKIIEGWNSLDQLGLLKQIGVIKQ